jgi:hypothetical protein
MHHLILADIHANIDALDTIAEPFDRVLVLGDLVDYGAAPEAAVQWVRDRGAASVAGKHDVAMSTASEWRNSPAPYALNRSPTQSKVVTGYIARVRARMVRILDADSIRADRPRIGAIHAIRTNLVCVWIALEEMTPERLRGYGQVPGTLLTGWNGMVAELRALADKLDTYLELRPGRNLRERLETLEAADHDVSRLKALESVISRYGLVEFRPMLANVLAGLKSETFEIAFFGRVLLIKADLVGETESRSAVVLP